MSHNRVVVGMSGGVDSSVAALLLKRSGMDVTGVFMKNWEDDDGGEYCSSREDFIAAASAAEVIGIDFSVVNFSAQYKEQVFSAFLREYASGRTPNPDILCNAAIKFSAFLDHALSLGADHMATGHYAQRRCLEGRWQLIKAEDGLKDQSYFLYRLNQSPLAHTLFPIGHLRKSEVREIARQAGLANHARKDSTGICFIGERPFRAFLSRYLPRSPGEIRTLEDDRPVGQHEGLMYYTLGQREGLHIGGVKGAEEAPWYVAGKDASRNVLQVVQGHHHPALLQASLVACDLHWVEGEPPKPQRVYAAKTRYRMPDAPCTIEAFDEGRAHIRFAQPQWAVTPGQSLVLYDGEICLGGGVITGQS
jgi:tRNA-specific 2-thiouridylase